jgi:hypothetical protein
MKIQPECHLICTENGGTDFMNYERCTVNGLLKFATLHASQEWIKSVKI